MKAALDRNVNRWGQVCPDGECVCLILMSVRTKYNKQTGGGCVWVCPYRAKEDESVCVYKQYVCRKVPAW